MLRSFQYTCPVCHEGFNPHETRLWSGIPGDGFAKAYHPRCVDHTTPLNAEGEGRWAAWKVRQVEEDASRELAALRRRTTALYEFALRMMQQLGCTPEEIEDFKYEYRSGEEGGLDTENPNENGQHN